MYNVHGLIIVSGLGAGMTPDFVSSLHSRLTEINCYSQVGKTKSESVMIVLVLVSDAGVANAAAVSLLEGQYCL